MEENGHDMGMTSRAEDTTPTVSAGGVATSEMPHSNVSAQPSTPAQKSAKPGPWLVAIVKRNSEKTIRDSLRSDGLEAYVATQTIMRRYAKRRPKLVEYVRIPAKVFVRMFPLKSEKPRSDFFKRHPYVNGFMPDRAKSNREWAAIPDSEMRQMRQILGDTDHEVTFGFPDESYAVGGKVRAVGGILHGLEGLVASRQGKDYFCVEIKGFDWARISISKDKLEPIQ